MEGRLFIYSSGASLKYAYFPGWRLRPRLSLFIPPTRKDLDGRTGSDRKPNSKIILTYI